MPPKRKRADESPTEAASSTRATRSSSKSSGVTQSVSEGTVSKPVTAGKGTGKMKATKSGGKASGSDSVLGESEAAEAPPPAKKARAATSRAGTSKAKSSSAVTLKGSSKNAPRPETDDEPTSVIDNDPNLSNKPNPDAETTTSKATKSAPMAPTIKAQPHEPYSPSRALTLFKKYADPDDPNVIGPEGFTQICTDAQIALEGALPLILAWQLQATEMGKFTKEQWVAGTGSLQISSLSQLNLVVTDLENILILGKEPIKVPTSTVGRRGKSDDPYDRSSYWAYAADRKTAFQKLYTFCFALAKPEQARNIDIETATAFWSVLLSPQYLIMEDIIQFINEKGTYKGANKDLWSMMLEFCQTVNPSLQNYEADGAWPTLLDDFVSWKKDKADNGQKGASVHQAHD